MIVVAWLFKACLIVLVVESLIVGLVNEVVIDVALLLMTALLMVIVVIGITAPILILTAASHIKMSTTVAARIVIVSVLGRTTDIVAIALLDECDVVQESHLGWLPLVSWKQGI